MSVAYPDDFEAHATDLAYHPSGTPNQKQYLNLFLPSGPRPRDGFPCLLYTDMAGWTAVSRPSTVTRLAGVPFQCLRANIAVAWFSCTITDTLDADGNVIQGRGLFPPAGLGGYQNINDFAERDAAMATQYVRRNASTLKINPNLVYGMGSSAGADAILWAAYGPDKQGETGYYADASSRLNGCIVSICRTLWRAHDADVDVLFYHFPDDGNVPPYNGAVALTLEQTYPASPSPITCDNASVLKYGFNDSDSIRLAREQKIHMWSSVAAENSNFREGYSGAWWNNGTGYGSAGEPGNGWPHTQADPVTDIHSSYHLYMLKRELERGGTPFAASGAACRLVVTSDARATWAAPKPRHDLIIESKDVTWIGDLTTDRVEWLLDCIRAA